AEDGDPLDVLTLTDAPVLTGCVLRTRLIGVIEARQKKGECDWYRNDRLIAVATHARSHEDVKSIRELRPHLLDDIEAFFVDYNELRGRFFELIGIRRHTKATMVV